MDAIDSENTPISDEIMIPGIPAESFIDWAKLCEEDLRPLAQLKSEVEAYAEHVKQTAETGQFVDLRTAEGIAASSMILLSRLGSAPSTREHRLAQAAIRYFILEEDGEGDLNSVCGFDDDAEVMNAVLVELGHNDLCVAID